jgi:hypothetical protein
MITSLQIVFSNSDKKNERTYKIYSINGQIG